MRDKEKQRIYQREWIALRRKEWFEKNGPCVKCGSWEYMELDHIDPKTKVSHNVWSWNENRRNIELVKCQVLCYDCHLDKSIKEKLNPPVHGSISRYKSNGYKCRCDLCRKAVKLYMRGYRSSSRVSQIASELAS